MRILIVSGLAHSRESLVAYLQLQAGLVVVGEAASAAGAITLAQQTLPDIAIMDVNLPDVDGFAATRELQALTRPPAVILLTVHRQLPELRKAQEAGAVAYIEKSAGVDAILTTLRTISTSQNKETKHENA